MKNAVRKMRKATGVEKIFAKYMYDTGLLSMIDKILLKLKKMNHPIKHGQQG